MLWAMALDPTPRRRRGNSRTRIAETMVKPGAPADESKRNPPKAQAPYLKIVSVI